METILDNSLSKIDRVHPKEAFLYCLSRLLERSSYYGLRSLIVLYMISESLKIDATVASSIYGWFISLMIFSSIMGAIIGDLIIGNKRSIIVGGLIQALGALSLCITSKTGLYFGLALVVLGGGLYTPNIISNYGKHYLAKTKLLDSGFTLFYLAINLGSILGTLLIGFAGEKYGWNVGFIIAGLLMLASIIPVFSIKEESNNEKSESDLSNKHRIINMSIAVILVGLFWAVYEISSIRIYDLQLQFSEFSSLNIPRSLWTSFSPAMTLIISVLAVIIWTYYYSTQIKKLTLGFVLGAISYGMLFLIPGAPAEQHTILFLASLLLLGVSEICIAPIVYSVLTQFSNPKYLAIIISLAFIPTRLFSIILGYFSEGLYENPQLAIKVGMIAMVMIGFALISFLSISKKTTYNHS